MVVSCPEQPGPCISREGYLLTPCILHKAAPFANRGSQGLALQTVCSSNADGSCNGCCAGSDAAANADADAASNAGPANVHAAAASSSTAAGAGHAGMAAIYTPLQVFFTSDHEAV